MFLILSDSLSVEAYNRVNLSSKRQRMRKQSIKSITLIRLLKVFVIAMAIVLLVVGLGYRAFFQFFVEKKVLTIAQSVQAGLTSHMKAGIMDKRDYFLNEISSLHDVKSIKVIRGDIVTKQFGDSTLYEMRLTDELREILAQKRAVIRWNDLDRSIEATVPYIANSQGALNCLQCHHAEEGDVLGGVNIIIETEAYQDFVLQNGYVMASILLILSLLIVKNMFYVIERYIRKPLWRIINDGEEAYLCHRDIDKERYESEEFEKVVENVNRFNHDVLEKEESLDQKNRELQRLNDEIESTLKETMLVMGRIEEFRSIETKRHTKRVALLSRLIAKEYGLDDESVALIELASPLHDIGKVGISDAILNKPERLDESEYLRMKAHAQIGYEILRHSERKILQTAATIAYEHHEKYDGTGYPRALKGEEISVFARIVAIVDVLDALLSKRVYKEVWSSQSVKELMLRERGRHFEPRLVDIVLENFEEYDRVIKELS